MYWSKIGLLSVVSLALVLLVGAELPVTINTQYGPVTGFSANGATIFLGVPYAAPPVGSLRWRPPQPHSPWTSYITRKYGAMCMQLPINWANWTRGWNVTVSEDCLYLNIFTPPTATPTSKLPVMFWIHGGAFVSGSGEGTYGDKLAAFGNVIVVTINYRLGILGFMALKALVQSDPNNINFGLQDQQFALQWVQHNIANFGGDPQKVTIFGESAGGGSVLLHTLMPSSWNYYVRGIAESPGPWTYLSVPEQYPLAEQVADHLGCPSSDPNQVACLLEVPAEAVTAIPVQLNPVVDGTMLPGQPRELFKQGQFNLDVPLIIGSNYVEGNLFAWIYADLTTTISEEAFVGIMKSLFVSAEFRQQVLAWYADAIDQGWWQGLSQITGDFFISCGARLAMQSVNKYSKQDAWHYVFSHVTEDWPYTFLNATHMAEIPFVFGNGTFTASFTPSEMALSKDMMSYWVNFATYGNPNGGTVPTWPAYILHRKDNTLVLNIKKTLTSSWDAERCSKWGPFFNLGD